MLEFNFTYVVLILLSAIAVGLIFFRNRVTKIVMLKLRLVLFVAILATLWFALPITPSLSTFGRPQDLSDMTPEKLLEYLQRYNDAIVRTTEIVHWLIFTMAIFLVGSVYDLVKYVDDANNMITKDA